jgi:hypothetical protein
MGGINPKRKNPNKTGPDTLSSQETQFSLIPPEIYAGLQRKALPKVPEDLLQILGLDHLVDQTAPRAS